MAPATPPRSRNRRGKAVCPSSPQLLTRPAVPVTPGSVSGKRHTGQLQKLRSPLNRSPARGLRTPEYTPARPAGVGASAQARRKLEFPDDQQELAGVGRVLFPGPSSDASTFESRLLSPPAPGRLLRDAPALLPPAQLAKLSRPYLTSSFSKMTLCRTVSALQRRAAGKLLHAQPRSRRSRLHLHQAIKSLLLTSPKTGIITLAGVSPLTRSLTKLVYGARFWRIRSPITLLLTKRPGGVAKSFSWLRSQPYKILYPISTKKVKPLRKGI